MKVYREFDEGYVVLMDDQVGKRAAPGSVFRFGVRFQGNPCVEMHQPGGTSGVRRVFDGETEDSIRAFLVGIGFEERPRATPEDCPSLA